MEHDGTCITIIGVDHRLYFPIEAQNRLKLNLSQRLYHEMWTKLFVQRYNKNDEGEGGVFRAWNNIEKCCLADYFPLLNLLPAKMSPRNVDWWFWTSMMGEYRRESSWIFPWLCLDQVHRPKMIVIRMGHPKT